MGHPLTDERTKVIKSMAQHRFDLHRAAPCDVKAALRTGMITDPEGDTNRM